MADLRKMKSRRKMPRARIEDERRWGPSDVFRNNAFESMLNAGWSTLDYAPEIYLAGRRVAGIDGLANAAERQEGLNELSRLSRMGAKDRPRPMGTFHGAAAEANAGGGAGRLLRELETLLPRVHPDHPGRMLMQLFRGQPSRRRKKK